MYYLDGLKSIPSSNRWYLVEKDSFLTDIFIRCILNHYNLKLFKLAKKDSLPDFLYTSDRNVCVVVDEFPTDPEDYKYFIKISKQPISKKWKELKFTEIICNDLFPNQISSFISFLNNFNLLTTSLTSTETSLLVEKYHHNLSELFEILQVLSYKADFSVVSTSKERSITGLVEVYLDGNYNLFFQSVLSERVDWALLITILIYNLIYTFKVKQGLIKLKSNWLKTKIVKRCLIFEPSFVQIMIYLQNIESQLRQGIISDAKIPLTRLSLFLEKKMIL